MAVSENDLLMLDGYLDDALSLGEVEGVRARLASDAEFAGALEQVRGERAARRVFFASLEPDDAAVAKLTTKIRSSAGAIVRRRDFGRVLRPLRYLSAAAACLLIGFFARSFLDHSQAGGRGESQTAKIEKIEIYQVTLRDEAGKVVGVQKFNSLEKAQEFAADLARWQSRSERLASGQFVLRNDRF